MNGEFFSVSDLSCAHHQVPLSPETQKLSSSIIGGRDYTNNRGFYGVCGLPKVFSRLKTVQFEPLIEKKQAITNIVHTLMQSQNQGELFSIIHEYHFMLKKAGLKTAPEKNLHPQKKWKFWDTSFHLKEYSQLQNGLRTWRFLKQLSPNELSWNFWDVWDFIVAKSETSIWTVKHSTISLEILLRSIGLKSTKKFFKW